MCLSNDTEATNDAGIVDLSEDSEEVLIGLEFLRAFDKGLMVFRERVYLVPDPQTENQPQDGLI